MTNDELAEKITLHGLQVFGEHAITILEQEQIIAALRQEPSGRNRRHLSKQERQDGTIIRMRSCPNCKEGWIAAEAKDKP